MEEEEINTLLKRNQQLSKQLGEDEGKLQTQKDEQEKTEAEFERKVLRRMAHTL